MIRTEVMDQPLETIRKPNGDLIGRGVIANLYKWRVTGSLPFASSAAREA